MVSTSSLAHVEEREYRVNTTTNVFLPPVRVGSVQGAAVKRFVRDHLRVGPDRTSRSWRCYRSRLLCALEALWYRIMGTGEC